MALNAEPDRLVLRVSPGLGGTVEVLSTLDAGSTFTLLLQR